ncbi:MAG: 50S ribosomal protein L4 [Candidatus Kariarchaeaceae archaeon]|jgi:large subunit ribosomal protein L4e
MTKVNIKSITGTESGSVDLPGVFASDFRPDLIKRAVLSEQSKRRQPQGRYLLAGKLTAATSVGPGRGIAKVPRTHSRGTHHSSRGAVIPSTRGGRLAHPPRVEKKIVEKINKKEYNLALRSAVSSTANGDTVRARGHRFDEDLSFPLVVEDKIAEIAKTKEMISVISNLGLGADLERTKNRSIRAGKGKRRGRKYRTKTGPLLVVADDCNAEKSAQNIPGVTVCKVSDLTVETLAPGASAGRATIWTESALKQLEEWN